MKQIGLVPELVVSDITKSKDFYTNVLGFSIVFERPELDFAYLKRGEAEIMIEQPGKSRVWQTGEFDYPRGRGINLTIKVDNVNEIYDTVTRLNLPIFMPIEDISYFQTTRIVDDRQFLIQDPDGYLLRLQQNMAIRPV